MSDSILWRGIYFGGHEATRLYQLDTEWCLEGTAVFSSENRTCLLSYMVLCDLSWRTVKGTVSGWLGNDNVNVDISVDVRHRWTLNGVEKPAVNGCVDLDLNFSPSTNLLPIRRLNLAVGQQAEVSAAWLRFPSFELEPLSQVYTRLDEVTYRYSSSGGKFVCDLTVNDAGFVTDYPGLWRAEQ
jgi:uncharacterized protein